MKNSLIGIGLLFLLFSMPSFAINQKIISTSPHITEILFALGKGNSIVGVTKYCNYPKEAKSKEIIGDRNINIEKIIKLNPDLIIADASFSSDNIEILKKRKFNILIIDCTNIKYFRESIKKIARATKSEKRAQKLLADFDNKISALSSKVKKATKNSRKRVFIEIWDSPLMTAGNSTIINELLELSGGEYIAIKTTGYSRIGTEFIIKENPDVILLTTSKPETIPKSWKNLKAVKTGDTFYIDHDSFSRPSFRMLDSCEQIFTFLYGKKDRHK